MDKNLLNIEKICETERISFVTIPESNQGKFLKINEGILQGETQEFVMEEEKILVVEIGMNVVYRLSFTKAKIDVFSTTDEPTINENILGNIEKELVALLNKKRMEMIY